MKSTEMLYVHFFLGEELNKRWSILSGTIILNLMETNLRNVRKENGFS